MDNFGSDKVYHTPAMWLVSHSKKKNFRSLLCDMYYDTQYYNIIIYKTYVNCMYICPDCNMVFFLCVFRVLLFVGAGETRDKVYHSMIGNLLNPILFLIICYMRQQLLCGKKK